MPYNPLVPVALNTTPPNSLDKSSPSPNRVPSKRQRRQRRGHVRHPLGLQLGRRAAEALVPGARRPLRALGVWPRRRRAIRRIFLGRSGGEREGSHLQVLVGQELGLMFFLFAPKNWAVLFWIASWQGFRESDNLRESAQLQFLGFGPNL